MNQKKIILVIGIILFFISNFTFSAYHHQGEMDSDNFLAVYPDKAGSKLDHCALCHSGGDYEKKPGVFIKMGSCQWCHYKYGYDASGNIVDTLNGYGKDYFLNGRNDNAIKAIEGNDSDKDGYLNKEEIIADRFPGSENDDPGKIIAPFKVYSKADLEKMQQHTQFLLMNTSRSGDFYAEYSGVILEDLLEDANILPSATGILVYAPDGWSAYHPLEQVEDPSLYHIKGIYPQSSYYYDLEAESWCDYSAPLCQTFSNGDIIPVTNGLRAILAIKRNNVYLDKGVLNDENKLDGSGPFRIVVPQKTPLPPDQLSTADNQNVIWPYNDDDGDHNAGYCTRTVTIIKVEPLPEGTTDIDIMEAGWNFVDQEKIIIYGAIKGESGSISGKILTSVDNSIIGMSNTTVTVLESGHSTVTDAGGNYTIENVPAGVYTIKILKNNSLLSMVHEINVTPDQTTAINPITLIKQDSFQCDIDMDGKISIKEIIAWLKKLAFGN